MPQPSDAHARWDVQSESFVQIAPFYDELMRDVPYRSWFQYVLAAVERHGLELHRALDLACGTGTISLMLAAMGYDVVGVDGSAAMLEVARRKARKVGSGAEFYESDLRSFVVPGAFDLAICLYDSLNNILEPQGIFSVFQRVAAALRPGGLYVFDVNTDYALRANLFTQEYRSERARVQYDWQSSYDYTTRICTVTMDFWVLEAGERQHIQEVHRQRAYSQTDLDRMLRESGLTPLGAYDGLSLRPPHPRSDRIYWVARRDN